MSEHGHDDDETEEEGIEPITKPPATISPHATIGPGLAMTARTDVATAV